MPQLAEGYIPLIPLPASIEMGNGKFVIGPATEILYDNEIVASELNFLNAYLKSQYGVELKKNKSSDTKSNSIFVLLSTDYSGEAYSMLIDSSGVMILAGNNTGVFYALQSLIQLMPAGKTKEISVPALKIEDSPRFGYRGMHLDVSRHFFPIETVKRYIDLLAMYKMNVFHWHLTDDQGWRIEIKKYPKLQSISAWRTGTLIGHLHDKPEKFDSLRHGGYYTQDEIKDVVEYASRRHVTIIPEIEMPGHALAALAAYPEYSCTGGPFEVGRKWGVFEDVFCPRENTFIFLQDILDEVCTLFPGKYIHIGGDECPKDRWKECEHCQTLIKKENLKDENELQRYFTNRIVTYLKTKNKTAIGWDEILDEKVDKEAVIMSWRGYKGGVDAALQGHDAVMAPHDFCYFNTYQTRYSGGRLAIGGYLPVDRVYNFEPVPDVLNPEQAKYIIGAQGNLWTEYITNEDQIEEMILPRMSALSEVLWTPSNKKDFNNYSARLVSHFKLLKFLNLKYSTALFDIRSKVTPNGSNGIFVELLASYPKGQIYYTMNGTEPDHTSTLYSGKIPVTQSTVIKGTLYEGLNHRGSIFSQIFNLNMATGKQILLTHMPHEEYNRGGALSLVNGVTGSLPWLPSDWLGFLGKDLEASIDLGVIQPVTRVTVDVLKDVEGRIYPPVSVIISVSENGKDFIEAGFLNADSIKQSDRKLKIQFPKTNARWVKVFAKNSNGKDWLFVDEITVE